jgi:syntaxin 6
MGYAFMTTLILSYPFCHHLSGGGGKQDTAVNTHELKDAKKMLKRHIKNAESTLSDVQMTVQLIENDRDKFQEISDNELYERSSLVHTSRDRLNKAKEEMTSSAVKAKLLQDERTKALRRAGADSLGAKNDAERMNTSFIVDSQARTSLLMQHQDETLDELDAAVTRVGHLAEHIHDEVGQQNKMLSEMEEDLADAEEQLGVVMGKLGKFLQTKDRFQLGTILALFFTVVFLFFLVVYT